MEAIITYFLMACVTIIITYSITGIVYICFLSFIKDKNYLKIKLPKSKKYKDKLSPIYELDKYTYDDKFYIKRWSLQWRVSMGWVFLLVPLMYPTEVSVWGYFEDSHITVGKKEDVERLKNSGVSLKDFYEEKLKKYTDEHNEEMEKRNSFTNMVDELNTEFNENYIK